MKTFFKSILALIFLSTGLNINAQNSEREIGLVLSDLTNFGIVFKKQTKENRYLQINALRLQSRNSNSDISGNFNLSAGLSVGFEKRRRISEQLFFMHGFQPFLYANYQIDTKNDQYYYSINPGLGYMIGFILDVGKNVRIGLQTAPNVNITFHDDNMNLNSKRIDTSFYLGNFSSRFMITYVFEKVKE